MMRKVAIGIGLASMLLGCVFVLPGCPSQQPPEDTGPGNSGVTGKFVGAATCALCHKNTHDNWAATLHAQALDHLEAIGEGTNPACLLCHTVGFGQDGGFVDRHTTDALAGVQCESCHGAARDHTENVSEAALRPPVSVSSDICAQCHNAFHHAIFDEWNESGHATVTPEVAEELVAGTVASNCGVCHSGDVRLVKFVLGEPVPDNLLEGKDIATLNAVECATCHDPHERTNRAFLPPEGHDFQLRYAEVVPFPTASNLVADTTNPDRFNLCGQCHHDRGRVWTESSRPTHHSIQSNFYVGEMPVPAGTEPLVPNQRTVHAFAPKQCVTCHMQREVEADVVSAIHANHGFVVTDFTGCSAVGCHPTPESAQADKEALQAEIQAGLDAIKARLGDPATWEYVSNGGPPTSAQANLPNEIKQTRFLYYYVLYDLSLGVHNPEYARSILVKSSLLLTSIGM
jgi:hypothetical protein